MRSRYGEVGGVLTSGFPWLFMDWFIPDIPHSFLEYGMGVIGLKKDLVHHNLWWGGMWKSLNRLNFSYVNKS